MELSYETKSNLVATIIMRLLGFYIMQPACIATECNKLIELNQQIQTLLKQVVELETIIKDAQAICPFSCNGVALCLAEARNDMQQTRELLDKIRERAEARKAANLADLD